MAVSRQITGFAVAVVALLGVLAAPVAAISIPQKQMLLYQELASVSVFNTMYANRIHGPYNEFNWTTDLCSFSPENPFGFNFSRACRRHDFNYRNFKDTRIFTSTNKTKIDAVFYNDARAICAPFSWLKRISCNGLALTYYNAIRAFAR